MTLNGFLVAAAAIGSWSLLQNGRRSIPAKGSLSEGKGGGTL